MKFMYSMTRSLWIIVAALLVMIPLSAKGISAGTIEWQSYDKAQQSRLDRKLLIYFMADWCGYCRSLEKKTFTDQKVIDYINQNFLPVRINIDKEQQIAGHFGISGVPALQFLTPKGEPIARWPGFIEAKQLLPLLKYIKTDSYKTKNFNEFMKKNS